MISAMINEILIGDARDVEILKLKTKISQFKAYDAERKAYYAQSMQRLGELESYVQELEDSSDDKQRIHVLTEHVRKLNKYIQLQKIDNSLTQKELDEQLTIANLKKSNSVLRSKVKRLEAELYNLNTRIK